VADEAKIAEARGRDVRREDAGHSDREVVEPEPLIFLPAGFAASPVSLGELQRSAGNAAVGRLIARASMGGGGPPAGTDDELDAGSLVLINSTIATRARPANSLQRQTPTTTPDQAEPNASVPEQGGETSEDVYIFSWEGRKYQIPKSQWSDVCRQATQALSTVVLPKLDSALDEAQRGFAAFHELEDTNYLGPFVMYDIVGIPRISAYEPLLSVAQARVAFAKKVFAIGDIGGATGAVEDAQGAVNDAFDGLDKYMETLQAEGKIAIAKLQLIEGAAFAAVSAMLGAVLTPYAVAIAGEGLGATALAGGASSGATSFVQSLTEAIGDATVGKHEKTAWEDIKDVTVSTVLNALGGAAGSVIADKLKGPVTEELKKAFAEELKELSEEAATSRVKQIIEGFAGGLSNVVQGVIADLGGNAKSVLFGQMTFDQLKTLVVRNMIANGIGGAFGGRKVAKPQRW
jgi:hypothetical protein